MNALEPSGSEILVGLLGLALLAVVAAAIVDAVRQRDTVSVVLLLLLGPIGLIIYVVRRSSRTAAA